MPRRSVHVGAWRIGRTAALSFWVRRSNPFVFLVIGSYRSSLHTALLCGLSPDQSWNFQAQATFVAPYVAPFHRSFKSIGTKVSACLTHSSPFDIGCSPLPFQPWFLGVHQLPYWELPTPVQGNTPKFSARLLLQPLQPFRAWYPTTEWVVSLRICALL